MSRVSKAITVAATALVSLAFASSASALVIEDVVGFGHSETNPAGDLDSYGGQSVSKLESLFDHVAWTHHFEFAPPYATIDSASLSLWFYDDEEDKWWDPQTWEFGGGVAESGDWDIGPIDTGKYSYDIGVHTLGDGEFSVLVKSLGGDFYLNKSKLLIEYTPHSVPEPATLSLLGLALLGFGLGRRRFATRR